MSIRLRRLVAALVAAVGVLTMLTFSPASADYWPPEACEQFYDAHGFYPEGACDSFNNNGSTTTTSTTVTSTTTTTTTPPSGDYWTPEACERFYAAYGFYPEEACPSYLE